MAILAENECFIPVENSKLFCRVFGNNDVPIIVLHGGPGLGQNYLLPQMSEIGNFASAIFYDQRGTGNSEDDITNWQSNPFQLYVRDLEQLRMAFGFEKFSLLTHSWGSILASHYVSAHPEYIDKIMFVNPVPISSKNYLEFVEHRSQIVDANKEKLDSIRASREFAQGDPETIEKFYRIYFKKYFAKPELADALTLKMTPAAAINNFKIYEYFYNYTMNNAFDLYEPLKKLNKRTLIIAGDKDVIPVKYSELLHQTIPSSQFTLIEDCGHFSYIDQPEILFKTLKDFVGNT